MLTRTNVVIITYNALEYTRATIESLYENTDNNFYLTVVDNNSRQDTVEYLDSLRPAGYCKKVTIIKNDDNMGVGYAYNQGQQLSFDIGVEFTAFCNNDLYFSRSWLRKLENSMDHNKGLAMLCPLRPSAKVTYDGSISTRDKLFQIPEVESWQQELLAYTELTLDQFSEFSDKISKANGGSRVEEISFPDSLSTCVCLTRNSVFRKIGNFADPSLALSYGGEDIDMCWTVMKLGYGCAIDHGVYVHHFRGKSLASNNMNRTELLKVSNRVLYSKWSDDIWELIDRKAGLGEDVVSQILTRGNSEYWLLYELNNDIEFIDGRNRALV